MFVEDNGGIRGAGQICPFLGSNMEVLGHLCNTYPTKSYVHDCCHL